MALSQRCIRAQCSSLAFDGEQLCERCWEINMFRMPKPKRRHRGRRRSSGGRAGDGGASRKATGGAERYRER